MFTIFKQRINRHLAKQKAIRSDQKKNIFYFAYGANISESFFKSRIPHYNYFGLAELQDYEFSFNMPCEYKGKGFGGIQKKAGFRVYGCLYQISEDSLNYLDWAEWLPFDFYKREKLTVLNNGQQVEAEVYIPSFPKSDLSPSSGYVNLIVKGLNEVKAPQNYIHAIAQTPTQQNFDIDHSFNLSNPGHRRWLPAWAYIWHDKFREWVCERI